MQLHVGMPALRHAIAMVDGPHSENLHECCTSTHTHVNMSHALCRANGRHKQCKTPRGAQASNNIKCTSIAATPRTCPSNAWLPLPRQSTNAEVSSAIACQHACAAPRDCNGRWPTLRKSTPALDQSTPTLLVQLTCHMRCAARLRWPALRKAQAAREPRGARKP